MSTANPFYIPGLAFLAGRQTIFYADGKEVAFWVPDATTGSGTFGTTVNGVTGVEGLGGFVDVSIEQIIAWDPDFIWVPQYATYTVEDLMNDPAWSSLSAVQNNRVYMFPSNLEPWDQPTAAVALGIDWALYRLHPDLFNFETLMQNVDADPLKCVEVRERCTMRLDVKQTQQRRVRLRTA